MKVSITHWWVLNTNLKVKFLQFSFNCPFRHAHHVCNLLDSEFIFWGESLQSCCFTDIRTHINRLCVWRCLNVEMTQSEWFGHGWERYSPSVSHWSTSQDYHALAIGNSSSIPLPSAPLSSDSTPRMWPGVWHILATTYTTHKAELLQHGDTCNCPSHIGSETWK